MGHVEEPRIEVPDALGSMAGDLAVQPDEGLLHHVLCPDIGPAQQLPHVPEQRALVEGHDRHQIAGVRSRFGPSGLYWRTLCAGQLIRHGPFIRHLYA